METPANVSSSAASNSESVETIAASGKPVDVGWQFGTAVTDKVNRVKCNLCGREVYGGVNRLKQHIARIRGNVAPCDKSTPLDQDICSKALAGIKRKKDNKKEHIQEMRNEVKEGDVEIIEVEGVAKKPHLLGPLDEYVRPIEPEDSTIESRKMKRQQNINDAMFKKRTNGKKLAVMARSRKEDKFDIVAWWTNYGSETPHLQTMALKIVSLTSSSSGCERNWSCFEGVHTKKKE